MTRFSSFKVHLTCPSVELITSKYYTDIILVLVFSLTASVVLGTEIPLGDTEICFPLSTGEGERDHNSICK